MSRDADDSMQQAEIEEIAALYREASGEEPSARHDAQVLAAARAGLRSSAKAKRTGFRRWRIPFAFAAISALAVSLTLTVDREQSRVESEPRPKLPEAAPPPPSPPSVPAAPTRAPAGAAAPSPSVEVRQARIPKPVQRSQIERDVAPAPVKSEPPRAEPPPVPEPPPPESVSKPAVPVSQPPAVAAPLPDAASRYAPAHENAAPLAAPKPVEPAPQRMEQIDRPQSPPAVRSSGIQIERQSAPAPLPPRTPEQWIMEIRALRGAGREAEAQTALKQFRLAYPDLPVPEDLAPKP